MIEISEDVDDVSVLLGSANTDTFLGSYPDVTIFTPRRSPRVSDDPIVPAIFIAPSDHVDGMVNVCWTTGIGVQYTASIHREYVVSSSECNGEYTLLEGSLMLGNRVTLNLTVISNSSNAWHTSPASTSSTSVWVVL